MKTKLFALQVNVWNADDFLNERNTNPTCTDWYLFASEEATRKFAKDELYYDHEVYNDGTIYTAELDDEEILEVSGFDTMDMFRDALAEPYSKESMKHRNFGEFEKEYVAEAVAEACQWDGCTVDCANYDFDKSLEGAIIVTWEWQTHVGYARNMIDLRYGTAGDTEALLTKEDRCYRPQCDVVLTKEEVDGCDDLDDALHHALMYSRDWKWTNKSIVEELIDELS